MGLAPFILILEMGPENLAPKVNAAKRKEKHKKTTMKEKFEDGWDIYYLHGQKPRMSSTPLISHHPVP